MAGDLKINEAIHVRGTSTFEVHEGPLPPGTRPIHEYGEVLIMELAGTDAHESMAPLPQEFQKSRNISAIGALGAEAFALRQSDKYIVAKSERPRNGETWNFESVGGISDNAPHPIKEEGEELSLEAVVGGTSQRMTGRISVGIIIVEGPHANLKFSNSEAAHVVAEVQNGLGWLATLDPSANITWVYDIHRVTVDTDPGYPKVNNYEAMEAPWRDPALTALGYSKGLSGVRKYIRDIRTKFGTRWTYAAFFTKYPTTHFAYAGMGGPRLVMQYQNDGWGPDNIDRVFAHESGHIFQAPDEYSASGCSCGGNYGVFNVPNANCETCASNGGVSCIMRSNDWSICAFTRAHFGFPGITPVSPPVGPVSGFDFPDDISPANPVETG